MGNVVIAVPFQGQLIAVAFGTRSGPVSSVLWGGRSARPSADGLQDLGLKTQVISQPSPSPQKFSSYSEIKILLN